MKRLLLFFLLLSAYASQAQTIQKINVYGYQYNRLVMDSAFGLPKDTFSVPVSYRHLPHISAKDTAIYIWSPALQKWRLASAGGSGGVATAWGQLTGAMSSQTDLQTALNAKQNSLTTGTSLQYRKGDHSLGTFSTDVLAVGNPVFAPINHGHNGLIPPGGLPGQILKKKSISDWDMDWYYEDTTASAVASVNGRTGAVTAQATDYAAFYPSLTGYNKTNWDNAYSWGNHASAGYLTNITGKVAAGSNVTITGAGTTASPYTISSSGGGLGTVTYNANFNKVLVQDSITGNVYRQNAAIINLTSPANGDLLKYQSGQWVNYTPSTTPSVQFTQYNFTASALQSTYAGGWLSGKHLDVYREGAMQSDGNTTYGYTFADSTLTFYPSLSAGEKVRVVASTGAAWTTYTPPAPTNYIYQFSGADQIITPAGNSDFLFTLSQPFTVGFWGRITATGGKLAFGVKNGSTRVWDISLIDMGLGQYLDAAIFDAGGSAYLYSTTTKSSIGTWQYFTVTYNGSGVLKIYRNGTDVTSANNSGIVTNMPSGGTFKIGEASTYTSTSSQIDRLFVANTALSAAQVLALYNGDVPIVENQSWYNTYVLSLWNFNNTMQDNKSTHHGTATTPQYIIQ